MQPSILVDIIEINRWHPDKQCMVVDEGSAAFSLGKSKDYNLMCPETDEGLQWPIISKKS